jgi:FkbM family methyltransferase
MSFANIFRRFTRKSGILLRPYNASTHEDARTFKLLQHHKVTHVLDIGANSGDYAIALLDQGFDKNIISFEPLSHEHNILLNKSKKYSNWTIYEKCALGSEHTVTTINISQNSFSSSLLPMLDQHRTSAPESAYIGSEEVQVYRLDDVVSKLQIPTQNLFVKMDVQGYEYEILQGATETFKTCKGIQIEVSATPLYQNTKYLFEDYLRLFKEGGFELYSIHPVFTDKKTGQVLQYDLTYFRK